MGRTMRGCLSREDKVVGRTEGGRIEVKEETGVVAEEEEVATKGEEIEEIGMKVVVDFVVDVAVVGEEEEMVIKGDSDVTVSELKHMAEPGTSSSILQMFLEKTNSFYRSFLDKLYAVADLLTDRPEPKPPDSEKLTRPSVIVVLVSLGTSMPGNLTWTKKWQFEHFVKRRRRKV